MKSTVAMITAPRKVEFIEQELPPVGDDDMIIKIDAVGLCHSDLPAYAGKSIVTPTKYGYRAPGAPQYPLVVGHEPVATVVETGKNVKRFHVGDRVAGRARQSFRTYMHIANADTFSPNVQLFPIPETDKDYLCCLAEPLECVVNIVRFANPEFGQSVAVVGCGAMGLLTIAGLRSSGAKRIVAVDVLDEKLAMARELGATGTLNPKSVPDISEAAYLMTDGRFFDVVIEVTGSIRGLDTAMQMIRFAHKDGQHINQYFGPGKVLLPSVYTREEVFPARLGFNMMARTPVLFGVYPPLSVDPMSNEREGIAAYLDGRLPMETMITHRIPFEKTAEALEYLVTPPEGYIKGIVTF